MNRDLEESKNESYGDLGEVYSRHKEVASAKIARLRQPCSWSRGSQGEIVDEARKVREVTGPTGHCANFIFYSEEQCGAIHDPLGDGGT